MNLFFFASKAESRLTKTKAIEEGEVNLGIVIKGEDVLEDLVERKSDVEITYKAEKVNV